MTAFDFGAAMQKQAVGPYQQPRPTPKPAPQFNFGHARQMLAKHYPDYNADMTSRQVWDKTKELGVIQPGTRQLTPFQSAMKRQYRGQMPQEPVFAGPGKPGFKPPAQPQQPQVAQNPMQFGQQVAQGQQPQGVVPGQPLPVGGVPLAPGFVRTDNGQVRPMSQDYIGMMQRDMARQPQQGGR